MNRRACLGSLVAMATGLAAACATTQGSTIARTARALEWDEYFWCLLYGYDGALVMVRQEPFLVREITLLIEGPDPATMKRPWEYATFTLYAGSPHGEEFWYRQTSGPALPAMKGT